MADRGRQDRVTRGLWIAVAIVGPVTLAVSVGSPVAFDFPVRLGVPAAVVAAVGLVPRQPSRGWLVVVLAATGFSDALLAWTRAGHPHWALTVVMALNGLQAVAAMGALMREARVVTPAGTAVPPDYSAYVRMLQTYQAYAAQYQPAPSDAHSAARQGAAHGRAGADAGATAAGDSYAELHARYAQHDVGAAAQRRRGSGGERPAGPGIDPGMPGANRGAPGSDPYRAYRQHPGDNTVQPPGP
ncbi:DUF5336 domain-containing protein [Mycobacterium sp. 050134]|uniref:DUF5336 domain-containing protein n=1 Tax=Mycobacterium sp. 050134 TaxID=3096111 RepID=UPI002EDB534E